MFTFPVSQYAPSLIPLPTRSLSFTRASAQSLSMTDTNFGPYNRLKFSFEIICKRASIGTSQVLFAKADLGSTSTIEFYLLFNAADQLNLVTYSSGPTKAELRTTAAYTDTTAFHRILVWYDGNNATAGDRMRLWYDDTEVTSFGVDTNPAQAAVQTVSTIAARIGAFENSGAANFFDGLLLRPPTLYSGYLLPPTAGWASGVPKPLPSGSLYSLLNTNATAALEDDYVRSTNWTNNNVVIKSTTIP